MTDQIIVLAASGVVLVLGGWLALATVRDILSASPVYAAARVIRIQPPRFATPVAPDTDAIEADIDGDPSVTVE